ncbi:MAG: ArsR family transcriptional regulator [Desulfurococcales archaeon]|nr:ArsR family transcriptional regulator [Desulfurococcales archaeon]
MRVEEFCDPVTVRILLYILREGQSNITRISRELEIHHRVVKRHMDKLKAMGVVDERTYKRMRVYVANLKDSRVAALKDLLEELAGLLQLFPEVRG